MFTVHVTQEDVENFVGHLVGRGWIKAKQLYNDLGLNDRHIRALAEASRGRVVSGNQGYKATTEASSEELKAAMKRQRSQVEKTLKRCDLTEEVWVAAQSVKSRKNPF